MSDMSRIKNKSLLLHFVCVSFKLKSRLRRQFTLTLKVKWNEVKVLHIHTQIEVKVRVKIIKNDSQMIRFNSPGVDRTRRATFDPIVITSPSTTCKSAWAPLIFEITDWGTNKFKSLSLDLIASCNFCFISPEPVTWSACTCVFSTYFNCKLKNRAKWK